MTIEDLDDVLDPQNTLQIEPREEESCSILLVSTDEATSAQDYLEKFVVPRLARAINAAFDDLDCVIKG